MALFYLIFIYFSFVQVTDMVRICAVSKCSNGLRKLKRWREQDCPIHGSKYGISKCICLQQFYLFGFPSEASDPDARKEWIKLVNRKGKKEVSGNQKPGTVSVQNTSLMENLLQKIHIQH